MHKRFLTAGAIFGGLGVALGAFGAHGLEKLTTDEKILHGYQTGVQYQLYHALALLATAFIFEKLSNRWIKWAGNCFIAGILLFSGSLYLLTLLKIQKSSGINIIGPVTPLGGLFFIAGWACLLVGVISQRPLKGKR
jgi:uncharacterized membrane protein YgdD (TMEM256/DUF423 family)